METEAGGVWGRGLPGVLEDDWSRNDAVSMSRLRSGHSLELGAFRVRVVGSVVSMMGQ